MKTEIKSFEELINSKLNKLSKNEKLIANYFLENYNNLAFLSIHEISDKLSVGKSSIVRFTKKLGYDGFHSFKKDIKNQLKSSIAPLEKFRLAINGSHPELTSVTEIAKNEVHNINVLLNNFDNKSFKKAVNLISNSTLIYTTGFNLSSFMAGIMSYLLQRIGLKSFPTNLGGRSLDEQLININNNDTLIAFSLPPYSNETIKAAEFAKRQNAKVISFTNSKTAPIVSYSDIVLIVKSDSTIFTNSFSATLVLTYSLVNEVALHNKERFKQTVQKKLSQSTTS